LPIELVFEVRQSLALLIVVGTIALEALVELKEVEILRLPELMLLAPVAHC
jgi:hypothetical protein